MSWRHRWQARQALWRRYGVVWRHFWPQRDAMTGPRRTPEEAEFLPAALALQSQPVSPAGRWTARVLIVLIVAALLWSILGKVDIVVNAQGKIIPEGRTKTISAAEVATVRVIHVTEGQAVKAGDLLVELDASVVDAERDRARVDQQNGRILAARSKALLLALETGRPPLLASLDSVDPEHLLEAQRHVADQWRDFVAKRNRLDGEIVRFSEALPLAIQRARDYADLAATDDVSRHAWQEREQQRIELQGQLNDARLQRAALMAETRRIAQDALSEGVRLGNSAGEDVRRAAAHGRLLNLVSPVAGTVQQLVTHTVGSAVPAATPLMQIVPRQTSVEMEAFVENKDVGFLGEGQQAQVKIDTFEYTRYGTIPARVTHVSRDAIEDEKRGLIYSVRLALERPTIDVDGRVVSLSPGMSGKVEIKTGTRRVIEYVLSPLMQHARESLRER